MKHPPGDEQVHWSNTHLKGFGFFISISFSLGFLTILGHFKNGKIQFWLYCITNDSCSLSVQLSSHHTAQPEQPDCLQLLPIPSLAAPRSHGGLPKTQWALNSQQHRHTCLAGRCTWNFLCLGAGPSSVQLRSKPAFPFHKCLTGFVWNRHHTVMSEHLELLFKAQFPLF